MDTLALLVPAIPVRQYGPGNRDAIAAAILLAGLLLVVLALAVFARRTGPRHHPR